MGQRQSAQAFAPASIGNVAVGFDMLGLAIEGAGDSVIATRSAQPGVRVVAIKDPTGQTHTDLVPDAKANTASVAAAALWAAADQKDGLELEVHKGVPLKSGMGSSAASAVAGVVAANALLETSFTKGALLPFAITGETVASGTAHADNVAPSLFGGMVLSPPAMLPRCIRLPGPTQIVSVLLHPDLFVSTAEARGVLATTYSMEQWLEQQGYLAAFVAGLFNGDADLIAASLKDVVIEPQRASAVPCFEAVTVAALEAGALGSSLSGSGPSIFALCKQQDAQSVAQAMQEACRTSGYDCQSWISSLAAPGARVTESKHAV